MEPKYYAILSVRTNPKTIILSQYDWMPGPRDSTDYVVIGIPILVAL